MRFIIIFKLIEYFKGFAKNDLIIRGVNEPILANFLYLYPLKMSEHLRLSVVFRGYKDEH